MSIGRLAEQLEEPNDQPFWLDVRFWSDASKTVPFAITSASGYVRGRPNQAKPNDPVALLTLTNADDVLVNNNVVGLRVPQVQMQTLAPGIYDIEVKAADASGATRQVRAVMKVVQGLGRTT